MNDFLSPAVTDAGRREELARMFNGSSLIDRWKPVSLVWDPGGEQRKPGDLAQVYGLRLFAPRALDVLRDLLEGRGEFLPVIFENKPDDFSAFNVTRLCPALDIQRSDMDFGEAGQVIWIEDYVLDPAALAGESIFRLAEAPAYDIYVTGEFVNRVTQAGLTGFGFRRVWSS